MRKTARKEPKIQQKIENRGRPSGPIGPCFFIFLLALLKKRQPLADGQALVSNTGIKKPSRRFARSVEPVISIATDR